MSGEALGQWVARLLADARAGGCRHLLVIAGERSWCHEQVEQLPLPETTHWLTREPRRGGQVIAPSKARTLLGLESEALVCDCFSAGFDPDALAALAGTVRAGGLIVLLTPPLAHWPGTDDPVARRMRVHGGEGERPASRYLRRIAARIERDPRCSLLQQGRGLRRADLCAGMARTAPAATSDDQRRVIDAIAALADSARPDALVVSADRGRGKSAALGMAVVRLLSGLALRSIWLTAPRLRNSEIIFDHLRRVAPEAELVRDRIRLGGGELRFIAPDALLQQADVPQLLIVDEAAAIPVAMLTAMLQRCERVVLASTETGYEGSGRGFATRFRDELDRLRPGWRLMRMAMPMRWSGGDPAASLLDDLLLLDAALPPAPTESGADLRIERLDRDRLADDEALLRAVFGLLRAAHYQTTPMDLRHLLDGDNIELWLARLDGEPVGAVMAAREGGLDASLSREIFRGRRRPRGHLLPQLLAARGHDPLAATRRCLRIIRIAVHPALRRRRYGSRLLTHVVERATDVDYVGASFAADIGVLAFWQRNAFLPLHFGLRANAASGAPAIAVGRGVTAAGKRHVAAARGFFVESMACLLADELRDLAPEMVAALMRGGQGTAPVADRRELLLAVAEGYRGVESSCAAVRGEILSALEEGRLGGLPPSQQLLLLRRAVQHHDWKRISREIGASGRKETITLFRKALRALLESG